jgi:hypothetical protein
VARFKVFLAFTGETPSKTVEVRTDSNDASARRDLARDIARRRQTALASPPGVRSMFEAESDDETVMVDLTEVAWFKVRAMRPGDSIS